MKRFWNYIGLPTAQHYKCTYQHEIIYPKMVKITNVMYHKNRGGPEAEKIEIFIPGEHS